MPIIRTNTVKAYNYYNNTIAIMNVVYLAAIVIYTMTVAGWVTIYGA